MTASTIRVLGCSHPIAAGSRTVCFLLDHVVLIDPGHNHGAQVAHRQRRDLARLHAPAQRRGAAAGLRALCDRRCAGNRRAPRRSAARCAHRAGRPTFSDEERALAKILSHLCPSMLGKELIQLEGNVAVHITHIKPGEVEAVMGQIGALGSMHRISALASGQVIKLDDH